MNERARAYKDAAEIVRDTRVQIADGPVQPWSFLHRVERYLNEQCSQEYAPAWQELREESVSA